eukprot:Clim_evm17s202 gene=Clim_evmTU17s202
MATKRLQKELGELQKGEGGLLRDLKVDEANILHWEGLLCPTEKPHDKVAYRIKIDFPTEYPFKPPKVVFQTPVYHPNIDASGNICLDVLKPEAWKPATKVQQVIERLNQLMCEPNFQDVLVADIGQLYQQDKAKYQKQLEESIKKHAEKRPKA